MIYETKDITGLGDFVTKAKQNKIPSLLNVPVSVNKIYLLSEL